MMLSDFVASYISGAASILIGNPLDILKVRLQAAASSHPVASSSSSTRSNLHSFTRGVAAPLLGYGALNAILFAGYNHALTLSFSNSSLNDASYSLWRVWTAGAVGGLASWIVSAPSELVKCRAQLSNDGMHSSWAIAKRTWNTEGVKGLYLGGGITSVRDAVGYGFYFWSYELSKRVFAYSSPHMSSPNEATTTLICGGIAGIVTWASVFPLDVIKTRVQTQPFVVVEGQHLLSQAELGSVDEMIQRKSSWEVAKNAYKEEGIKVFFKGLGVCSGRAFIVNAVQWFVYERMLHILS